MNEEKLKLPHIDLQDVGYFDTINCIQFVDKKGKAIGSPYYWDYKSYIDEKANNRQRREAIEETNKFICEAFAKKIGDILTGDEDDVKILPDQPLLTESRITNERNGRVEIEGQTWLEYLQGLPAERLADYFTTMLLCQDNVVRFGSTLTGEVYNSSTEAYHKTYLKLKELRK